MNNFKNSLKKNFTIVPNETIEDDRLSWKAKGIFIYLASRPDNWNFKMENIEKNSTDGSKSLKTGIKELEEFGYLRRTPRQNSDGSFSGWQWEVTTPRIHPFGSDGKKDSPKNGKTQKGADINKTDTNKKENNNTDNNNSLSKSLSNNESKSKAREMEWFERDNYVDVPESKQTVIDYCKQAGIPEHVAENFHNYYEEAGWCFPRGQNMVPVQSWKAKLHGDINRGFHTQKPKRVNGTGLTEEELSL